MLEINTITKFLLFGMKFIIDRSVGGGGVHLVIDTYKYFINLMRK